MRQPALTASVVSTGKKMSWPALTLAPKTPVTRPRSVTNHRFAIVGPSTLATSPLPRPATNPKKIVSCQISRENVDAISAAAVDPRLSSVTALIPMAAMSRPEIGPASPYVRMPTAAANERAPVLQPGSCCIESRNAPGAARTPAVATSTTAAMATTIQP
jgi:hypothetical protein